MAYISEISYGGNRNSDFVEVVVPSGTDVSAWAVEVFNDGGNSQRSISFDDPVATMDGNDVYLFHGSSSLGNINQNNGIALVDNSGAVVQFVSFEGNTIDARNGAADDQTSTNIGTAQSGESLQSTNGGTSYSSHSPTPGTMPCFGPGTRIQTPDGWERVENLAPADLVCTLDQGAQPIVWACSSSVPIEPDEGKWPILIKSGAFGLGLPENDLVLSGQHRVLAGGDAPLGEFFSEQFLLPAKSLTSLPRIRAMRGKRHMTWYHFAFARHAVCVAEGLAVESLYLGRMVLEGLPDRDRQQLHKLFGSPDADGALNGPRARTFMTVGETRRILSKPVRTAA